MKIILKSYIFDLKFNKWHVLTLNLFRTEHSSLVIDVLLIIQQLYLTVYESERKLLN